MIWTPGKMRLFNQGKRDCAGNAGLFSFSLENGGEAYGIPEEVMKQPL